MERLKTITVSGKEIISIDYSGLKPDAMIELFNETKKLVVSNNKECLLLANFGKTFITPQFVRHAEREMTPLKHLIKKNAFINLSSPQRMILKGFRLFIGSENYVAFDHYDEAIAYLISEHD